jgi:hypothetical protein
MKRMSPDELRQAIFNHVQPLYRGTFDRVGSLKAQLKDLFGFGADDRFQHALPYGLSVKPHSGMFAYFLNLLGKAGSPVILGHLDKHRPEPAAEGEVILYALTADRQLLPVKLTLNPDGTFVLYAKTKIQIGSASAAQPLVLGTELQTLLANLLTKVSDLSDKVAKHTHVGNLGYPTAPPATAAEFSALKGNFDQLKASPVQDGKILSDKSFTEK